MSREKKGGSGGPSGSDSWRAVEYARGVVLPGTSFRVRGILGVGAFGTVYDCDHLKLGVNAAVKLLNAELAHRPDLEALMLAEARRTAQIENDHVVKVRSIGVTKGSRRLYVEMFKLSGESLLAVLRAAGRLEALEAILYGLHIATGLAGAHSIGLIHCDVKPANIFLARIYDPMQREWVTRAVVLDLGVAQIATRTMSERGRFVGSPITAAPEQIDGRFYVQSDVFALGVTMFMMLTGVHPHGPFSSPRDLMAAKSVPARIKRLHDVLPAVAEGAFVDDLLDDLLWRMMQPAYTDRPPTMEHVIAELSLVQERQEERALAAAFLARGKVKPRGRGAATTPEPPEAMRARMRDHYTTQNEIMPTVEPEPAPPSIDELLVGMAEKRFEAARAEAQKRQIERFSADETNNMALPEDRRRRDHGAPAEEENARRLEARAAADEMGPLAEDSSTGSGRFEIDMLGIEQTAPMAGAPPLPAPPLPVSKARARSTKEPAVTGHGGSAAMPAANADSAYPLANTSADREFYLGGKSTQRSVADGPFDRASPAPAAPEERVVITELPRPDRGYNAERRPSTFAVAIDKEPERVPLQTRLARFASKWPKVSGMLIVLAPATILALVLWRLGYFDRPQVAQTPAPSPTASVAATSLAAAAPLAYVPPPPSATALEPLPSAVAPVVQAVPERRAVPAVPASTVRGQPTAKPPIAVATTSAIVSPREGPPPTPPVASVPPTPHGALIQ